MVKHVEVKNDQGFTLRGYLTMPNTFNGKLVIMYHGFTGNKTEHGGIFRDFARLLQKNDIASLRLDMTGNGESDGTFKDFNFDILLSDAKCILEYGKKITDVKKITLLGFSMGGAIVPMLAKDNIQDIDSLILWSPAGNIINKISGYYEKYPKLENGNADYPNFEISKTMFDSLEKYDVYAGIEKIKKPVLIIHGIEDMAVNYEYGIKYKNILPNALLHIIDGCGHGYDKQSEKGQLFEITLNFLK